MHHSRRYPLHFTRDPSTCDLWLLASHTSRAWAGLCNMNDWSLSRWRKGIHPDGRRVPRPADSRSTAASSAGAVLEFVYLVIMWVLITVRKIRKHTSFIFGFGGYNFTNYTFKQPFNFTPLARDTNNTFGFPEIIVGEIMIKSPYEPLVSSTRQLQQGPEGGPRHLPLAERLAVPRRLAGERCAVFMYVRCFSIISTTYVSTMLKATHSSAAWPESSEHLKCRLLI